ncbi:MAG: SagB/ThcOx family dehydrogenase [Armatimonadetes bacterium]|nr:SagB/ThcOx family dehydrogenase [Armatimonadota bacterium]
MLLPGTIGCGQEGTAGGDQIVLPAPTTEGGRSLVEAIAARRSVRSYTDKALTLEQISQLAWAAQGITEPRRGFRAAPSAGALYPLELYLLTKDGVFHYLPQGHALERLQADDRRMALAQAASDQRHVGEAALDIVIAAVFERTERKYGERARTYVYMEAGHVAQNVHLQAVALGLASCPVGALREKAVREVLRLPADHVPIYLVTVGHER